MRVIDTRISDLVGGGVKNLAIRDTESHTLALAMVGMKSWYNDHTLVMLEALGIPDYDYNPSINTLNIKSAYAFATGVRYFFTDWLALDAGAKYQTNYRGLADAAIRASVNVMIPTRRWYKQMKEARAVREADAVRKAAVERSPNSPAAGTPTANAQPPPQAAPPSPAAPPPLVSQTLTELDLRISRLESAAASPVTAEFDSRLSRLEHAATSPLNADQIAEAGSHLKTAGILTYVGLGSLLLGIPVASAVPALGGVMIVGGVVMPLIAPGYIISAGDRLQKASGTALPHAAAAEFH